MYFIFAHRVVALLCSYRRSVLIDGGGGGHLATNDRRLHWPSEQGKQEQEVGTAGAAMADTERAGAVAAFQARVKYTKKRG